MYWNIPFHHHQFGYSCKAVHAAPLTIYVRYNEEPK